MYTRTPDELQATIGELEQAIHNHEAWFEAINRTMLCRLPYDDKDTREDAHRICHFGEWLYHDGDVKLHELPAYSAIEETHRLMHSDAATLLQNIDEDGGATVLSYDRFAAALKRFRLEINTLKQELQDTLYSLDTLTSASNRIGMLTYLRGQQELAKRHKEVFCIAMLDLDRFKQVNDRHGHLVGDSVLKGVSRFVLDNIRPYDRLFRYGGEEFLLSMPQTTINEAGLAVERLRRGIEQLTFEQNSTITCSFGIAETTAALRIDELINRADQALYSAKQNGRNCTRVWDAGMVQLID